MEKPNPNRSKEEGLEKLQESRTEDKHQANETKREEKEKQRRSDEQFIVERSAPLPSCGAHEPLYSVIRRSGTHEHWESGA